MVRRVRKILSAVAAVGVIASIILAAALTTSNGKIAEIKNEIMTLESTNTDLNTKIAILENTEMTFGLTPKKVIEKRKEHWASADIDLSYKRFNGRLYKVFTEPVTWQGAMRRCEEEGGHLATITSILENDHIVKMSFIVMRTFGLEDIETVMKKILKIGDGSLAKIGIIILITLG